MRTFKLAPDGFKKIRQKTLPWTISITLLAAMAGLYMSSANQNTGMSLVDMLPIVIPIILVVLFFVLFRGRKIQKEMWETYELTIDGETITRKQNNMPTVTINKSDLQEMVESPQGYILLKTGQRENLINIPSFIQDKDELLKALADFGQINKQTGNKNWWMLMAPFIMLGLLVVFYTSKEKSVIISTGAILTVGLLWVIFEIQKSKLIDKKTKNAAYFIFLAVFSIVGRLLVLLLTT